MTLTPHATAYLERRRRLHTYSPKSLAVVQPRLRSLTDDFGRRPIDQFTTRAVEHWLESLEHLSVNSRAAYLASARQFTHWLAVEKVVRYDPCVDIPQIRRPRPVPRAQPVDAVAAFLRACHDDRERCIVHLMVGLGLRRMEVAALRWDHYDDRAELLLVVASKGGLGERLLPVPKAVRDALGRIRDKTTGPVIASKATGRHLLPATIGSMCTKIMQRSGVKRGAYDGISGHALRHTAASDVLDACGDLRVVQQMLGHGHLTSTAIYLRRTSAEELRDAMEGRSYDRAS